MTRIASKVIQTHFGPTMELELPPDFDIIILMELTSHGLRPAQLMMPHQLRLEKLDPAKEWMVLPGRSEDYIEISPCVRDPDYIPEGVCL